MKQLTHLFSACLLVSFYIDDAGAQPPLPGNLSPAPRSAAEIEPPTLEHPGSGIPSFLSPETAAELLRVDDSTDPVRKLQIEKVKLNQRVIQHLIAKQRVLGGSTQDILDAIANGQRTLLELAHNKQQKIAILKSLLKTLEQQEKIIQTRQDAINGVFDRERQINQSPQPPSSTVYVNQQLQTVDREDYILSLLQVQQAILDVKIEIARLEKTKPRAKPKAPC